MGIRTCIWKLWHAQPSVPYGTMVRLACMQGASEGASREGGAGQGGGSLIPKWSKYGVGVGASGALTKTYYKDTQEMTPQFIDTAV